MYMYFVPDKKGELLFYVLSQAIDMMPKHSSCFNQISLDSPGCRAYNVNSFKRCMGRVVQGEYQGKQLGIANCRGLKAESTIKVEGISHPKGLTGNLPKWATLNIMAYIILAVVAAKQTLPNYRLVHTGDQTLLDSSVPHCDRRRPLGSLLPVRVVSVSYVHLIS